MATRSLHFEVYSIHAHLENGQPVDYAELFQAMTALRGYHQENGTRQLAIRRASFDRGRLFVVAYTGYAERSLLFFDVERQTELTEETEPGRFQARKTFAMLDSRTRRLIINAKKGNLHPPDLASIIEERAANIPRYRELNLEITFAPLPDASIIQEIDALERIQAATVSLARPNVDWTERNDELAAIADESEAKSLDVTVRARRGKSLARETGVMRLVRDFVANPIAALKIQIVGQKDAGAGLVTLNLNNHVEHLDLRLEESPTSGQVNEGDVKEHMDSYLDRRAR